MEFYLTYQGPLRSNANSVEKHRIREYFKPQLEKIWDLPPLNGCRDFLSLDPQEGNHNLIKRVNGIPFATLVSSNIHMMCGVNITLLWPDEPGNIIQNSGDIDNRLKTLFDSLTCPKPEQISNITDLSRDGIFHCLLEDDKLISSVSVNTGTYLHSDSDHDVLAVIHVKTHLLRATCGNVGLG